MGAKVKPFSESAKSIGSFFRADAQEKARRLILPPKKNPDALGETIPLSIGQESLLRSQKYAFFLYRQIFQNLFSTGSTKKQPPKKRIPSSERQKKKRIYIIWFARVRETQKERKRNRMRRCFFLAKKDFLTEKNGNRLRKEEDTKGEKCDMFTPAAVYSDTAITFSLSFATMV
ncbi:hypothetical protein [Porphyromonas gingivalis]|uniref:hypothetical protein n=1 Tax=Porphyromonas gingivalis TaxID=837 RepID=UPI001F28DFBF|nr:hypothetical protein [Porphyromonas gingivalis]